MAPTCVALQKSEEKGETQLEKEFAKATVNRSTQHERNRIRRKLKIKKHARRKKVKIVRIIVNVANNETIESKVVNNCQSFTDQVSLKD